MLQIPLRKLSELKPQPAALDRIELASRDELAALQRERLAWSLRHAYENVPHYKAKFDAAGVHPDDFKDLSDLAKFPFTTKADLRDNYPFGMFAVPQNQIARIHGSSGTTGKPTVVGYTKRDIDTWADLDRHPVAVVVDALVAELARTSLRRARHLLFDEREVVVTPHAHRRRLNRRQVKRRRDERFRRNVHPRPTRSTTRTSTSSSPRRRRRSGTTSSKRWSAPDRPAEPLTQQRR